MLVCYINSSSLIEYELEKIEIIKILSIMSDIVERIRYEKKIQDAMYGSLMTHGTLFDGKERISELQQGTLAKGNRQNALQLGAIFRGEFHEVSIGDLKGPWLIHTHGKRKGQKYHPPSLRDILVTIERTFNDDNYKGISIVVAPEGFYILYPNRKLINRLNRDEAYSSELEQEINENYMSIFEKTKCGVASPHTLCEFLKKYNIICEYLEYSSCSAPEIPNAINVSKRSSD